MRSLDAGKWTLPTKSLRIFACSGTSRVPAPRPIAFDGQRGQRGEPLDDGCKDAAPVGVVISLSTIDSASGTPLRISAGAGGAGAYGHELP